MRDDNTHQFPDDQVLWDVMEEHLDEGGFLWNLWKDRLSSFDYTLHELGANEETRFLAHIDALAVAGKPVGEKLLLPALDRGDDSESVFAAASALLCSEDKDTHRLLIERLAGAQGELLEGLQGALELAAPSSYEERLLALQESAEPVIQAAVTDILACRGFKLNTNLTIGFEEADSKLQKALLHAVRSKQGRCYQEPVKIAISSPDVGVRNAALEAGLVIGIRDAWKHCINLVSSKDVDLAVPLELLGLLGSPKEIQLLLGCLEEADLQADAVWALGYMGTLEASETCLDLMKEKDLARLAGEAFCFITGLDIEQEEMFVEQKPEGEPEEPVPLEEDDLDTEPITDPSEVLIEPNYEAIRAWWLKNRNQYRTNIRYIQGRPHDPNALFAAFRASSLRRRRGLCLLLAIVTQGRVIIESRALCRVQQRQQDAIKSLYPKSLPADLSRLLQ